MNFSFSHLAWRELGAVHTYAVEMVTMKLRKQGDGVELSMGIELEAHPTSSRSDMSHTRDTIAFITEFEYVHRSVVLSCRIALAFLHLFLLYN